MLSSSGSLGTEQPLYFDIPVSGMQIVLTKDTKTTVFLSALIPEMLPMFHLELPGPLRLNPMKIDTNPNKRRNLIVSMVFVITSDQRNASSH